MAGIGNVPAREVIAVTFFACWTAGKMGSRSTHKSWRRLGMVQSF